MDLKTMPLISALTRWVDNLQAQGRYSFTRKEIEADTGRSPIALQSALRRLAQHRAIVSPRRGFYIVVPPEYRVTGSPPASWFIDDLMRFLEQPYYISLLTAAAFNGAAHQQPMIFQVMTDRPTREIQCGSIVIRFYASNLVQTLPVTQRQTETGTMTVATPEICAFDLIRYLAVAGHMNNVATVLLELTEGIDPEALVRMAEFYRPSEAQRLGYILEALGQNNVATLLHEWISKRQKRAVRLVSSITTDLAADPRWLVIPNVMVEPDL